MQLKTIGDLKKLIKNMDDNFKLTIQIAEKVPAEELKQSAYPYPWNYIDATIEYNDNCYSEKEVSFEVKEQTKC